MHIAIEGMDGVGKTTSGKTLANKLNFKFVEKPLHYMFDDEGSCLNYIKIRDYINQQVENDVLRAWFYGLGNIFLYHRFKNENIITDRHFASNYYWCGFKETEPIYEYMIEQIGSPDITFLLYASPIEGERRILNRKSGDKDVKKVNLYEESFKKMEHFLQKYNMKYVSIDTTNLNSLEVVEKMISVLKNNGNIFNGDKNEYYS